MTHQRFRTLQDFDEMLADNPSHFAKCDKCYCDTTVEGCDVCLSQHPSRLLCLICTNAASKPVTFRLERKDGMIIAES